MTDERTHHLLGIDPAVLTSIVRQATQRARAELVDWQSQALQGGTGDLGAGLVGTYRLSGHIRDEGEVKPWSLIPPCSACDCQSISSARARCVACRTIGVKTVESIPSK